MKGMAWVVLLGTFMWPANAETFWDVAKLKGIQLLSPFIVLSVAQILDWQIIHIGLLAPSIAFYYIIVYGIRIAERLNKWGVPVPETLRSFLKWYREDNNLEEERGNA